MYDLYDERQSILEEEFMLSHPACPDCGALMNQQREKYNLTEPYEDKWFECPMCGYCMTR